MHSANASEAASLPFGIPKACLVPGPPLGPELPPWPGLMLVTGGDPPCEFEPLVVVVLPRWATAVLFGLLPQAATSRAPIAINTPIAGARRRPSETGGTGGLGGLFISLVITRARLQERNSSPDSPDDPVRPRRPSVGPRRSSVPGSLWRPQGVVPSLPGPTLVPRSQAIPSLS